MTDDLLVSGNLNEIRLPTLLMSLYRNQETGVLSVQGEQYRKTLYIQEGNVVFASSTDPDDRLGETLLKRGIITVAQYLRSAEQIRPGRRQGEILLDEGALTPEGLVEGVREQVYDIIFSLFLQEHGTYALDMEEFSTLDMMTISMEMPLLILRGMSRSERWSVFIQEVGPPETLLRTAPSPPSFMPSLELGQDAEHLLSLSRNGTTVGALLESSYLNQFETYRTLWMFLTLGLLQRRGAAESEGRTAAFRDHLSPADLEGLLEHYNAIFAYIYRQLEDGTGRAESLVHDSLLLLKRSYPQLMEGQDGLALYGRLDIDPCLMSLRRLPEGERTAAVRALLDEILYALAFLADRHLDPRRSAEVQAHIRRESASFGG